jgi:hypothetical protein
MGDEEYAAIEQRFPRVWQLCVERGIITTSATPPPPGTSSTIEQIMATVDPNLATTDIAAYLKAVGDAFKAHKKKD